MLEASQFCGFCHNHALYSPMGGGVGEGGCGPGLGAGGVGNGGSGTGPGGGVPWQRGWRGPWGCWRLLWWQWIGDIWSAEFHLRVRICASAQAYR